MIRISNLIIVLFLITSLGAYAQSGDKEVTKVKSERAMKCFPMNEKIIKTDAEWKKILSTEQYAITRKQGTERAGTSKLLYNKEKGEYACVSCSLPLFNSKTKFESGTGWPSFFAPINKKNVAVATDNSLGMSRDEVICARCDAHLGHVFEDGPQPTGLRYCINGVALKFVSK
jgi:methionine-R-sulfoxide reductase